MVGESVSVLIYHGWKSKVERWQKVKEALEKEGCKVHLLPVPGFDTPLERPYTLQDYATHLYSFQTQHPFENLVVHSFGGRVLLWVLKRWGNPGWKKIILLNPAGFSPPRRLFPFSLPLPYTLKKLFYTKILHNPDPLEKDPLLAQTYQNVIKEDLTPYLSDLPYHLIFLWGKKDKVTPLFRALPYLLKLPSFELYLFSHWDHSPHLTFPTELAKIIMEILRR